MTGLPTESPAPTAGLPPTAETTANPVDQPIEDQPNEPLSKSDNEVRCSLAELDKHLVVDPAEMSPAASRYIRSRPWATPEFLREARCGYMPSDAKSTLRGQRVFSVFDEQGEPLCWVGRNLKYEEQMAKLRPGEEAPAKYRFQPKILPPQVRAIRPRVSRPARAAKSRRLTPSL